MYTKCPSCRAELSFLPPANPETLPEGYKHRIRCPHCGVTIGVKINKVDVAATYPNGYPQTAAPQSAPTYPQQQPYGQQQSFAPNQTKANENEEAEEKPTKRTGRPRNVMIMILSLIFVALTAIAAAIKDMDKLPVFLQSTAYLNGISGWELLFKDFEGFKMLFTLAEGFQGILAGVIAILPMILFTLSGVSFILALLGLIFKKYNRFINLLLGILIGASAVASAFILQIITGIELKEYFKMLFTPEGLVLLACAVLGLVYFVFTILFMKSMKIKDKEEEEE